MAVKFEFYLDDKDYDRLAIIKERMGENDMTFGQFAKYLLENELYRLQPTVPNPDEE